MTSWKNFGDWMNKFYVKNSELSGERKSFYTNLVGGAKTEIEKAKILYSYMQANMRYVSIQLGIGGIRPFPASFVDEKKYGDCKALSNYLRSALSAVGVKSNVVIIQGSLTPRTVLEDFPADYFNHVILCIPQTTDSIWLECTSSTLPFAQLGPFTENRKALMVTDEGGVLVNTPASHHLSNTENFITNIEVNEDFAAAVTTEYKTKGHNRNRLAAYFHDKRDDAKREFFIRDLGWKNPSIIDITTSQKTNDPYLINAKMDYDKIYSFKSGNRFFLESRLHKIFDEEIPETKERLRDYYFVCPYQSADSTFYKFPKGFTMETLPKSKSIVQPFARYVSSYSWDADNFILTVTSLLEIKDRIIKAADYQKLVEFKKQVTADSKEKIVMVKE